jgi:hypothetical protein
MDNRAFQIDCSVNPTGSFRAGANSLSVKIGQRISRFGAEEIWESVIVQGSTTGGELTVRVLVCNPDWDEPLQIACVRSNRSSKHTSENGHSIDCYLEHVVT